MLRIISAPGEYDVPPEWIDYYKRFVLTVKPEIYHEFTGASIVKAKNGEFDLALEISAVLEGLFPASPGILLNKALILEKKASAQEKNGQNAAKETAEALEAYETALSLEPVIPDALFNAGFFFMRQGEYKRAKDCFSSYVSEGEAEIPVELPMEKLKQAKKIIKEISSQGLDDSNFTEAYNCINNGNDEEGLSRIRDFLQKHPKAWNGWFVLGWALRKLGRYGDSLESLKKAVELGGSSSDLKNEMAICLMELGDFKQAQKELEQALRDDPENIKIISNLGVLAMKTGSKTKAASYFRYLLELDPADPLAKEWGLGTRD
jgi:tetratricopeptide (TPR) repeat protein